MKLIKKIIRKIKNITGEANGYGNCILCKDRWNWKEPQRIKMINRQMFPLCKECFNKLSERQISMWCVILMERWEYNNEEIGENLQIIEQDIHNLKQLEERKKG